LLDEVSCPQHSQIVSLQSIPSPLENQATKTKRLQTAPLDTNGAPLSMTKTTQIRLPQYDVLPLWAIFLCKEPTNPSSWSHIDCEATRVIDPLTLQPPCTTFYIDAAGGGEV